MNLEESYIEIFQLIRRCHGILHEMSDIMKVESDKKIKVNESDNSECEFLFEQLPAFLQRQALAIFPKSGYGGTGKNDGYLYFVDEGKIIWRR